MRKMHQNIVGIIMAITIAFAAPVFAEKPKTLSACKVSLVLFSSQRDAVAGSTTNAISTAETLSRELGDDGEFRLIDMATVNERPSIGRISRTFSYTTLREAVDEANPEVYLLSMWARGRVAYARNYTEAVKQFTGSRVIICDVAAMNQIEPRFLERLLSTNSDAYFIVLGDVKNSLSSWASNRLYTAVVAMDLKLRTINDNGELVEF